MVHVREYVRADGTRVRAHSRWAAGARREMSVLAVIALVVVGFAGTTGSGSADGFNKQRPRPRSTAVYPVKFRDWDGLRPRPTPTVSYPIPWDRGH
ncbi:hypothetical protein CG723_31155 [Streptomyces sp. CB01635]|uniref:hypothetical protein n=1 Tax=unclassified Streptomyces TaxID=2593676 RepID=UPI000C27071B|nr:hypothetical protein [Streptomyces sp. CB01635]PJN07860.1 hypothetical protein CG723_31155 [Streptomyces sp. CB01635]